MMSNLWIFSGVAAALVYLAGRRDEARDPRLTTVALTLLAAAPLLAAAMPKIPLLPEKAAVVSGETDFLLATAGWIWLAGTAAGLVRLLLAAAGLQRWHARSLSIRREDGVDVRELPGLSSPVAAGVFRKTIFVPVSSRVWSSATWRMVMAHERGHHLRHDPLRRWIAELAVAAYWFNPLVWWMARRLEFQCECACDASVLAQGEDARAYGDLLCDMASPARRSPHAIAMAQRSSLEQRVKRLILPNKPTRPWPLILMTATIVVSAACSTLIGSKSPHPPVYSTREIETRWSANPFPEQSSL
jgi:beta-lactamase regulating signal transducer with metallopeptidase domain